MFSVVSICQQGDRVRRCDHYLDVFGDPPSLTIQEPPSPTSHLDVLTCSFGPPPALRTGWKAGGWPSTEKFYCYAVV